MTDGGAPRGGDPTDHVLPDLTGGAGWDEPLPDLADPASVERLVDLGAGGAGADEPPEPTLDGPLPDLTLGGGGSGQRRRRRAGRRIGEQDAHGDQDAHGEQDARDAFNAPDEGPAGDETGEERPRRRRRRAAPTSLPGAVRPASSLLADPDDARSTPPADFPTALDDDAGLIFGPSGDASVVPPPEPAEGRGRTRRSRRRKGEEPESDGPAQEERPLTAEERLQHALKLAYRHLTKRDRTVFEVRLHLEKREIDEPSIAAALAELVEFRYLDDERYAARFVEDKRRLEGWGHLRIEQGLRKTGVPREIADRAVADDPLRADEAELAVESLERRFAGRAPEDDRGRQKALRALATKGYPLDTAYAAVRAYERRCAERSDGA